MINHDIECATANIQQALIELIADFLDSNHVEFEQSVARIKDPEPREKTELHIHMAKKAMEAYKATMVHYDGSGVLLPIISESEANGVCDTCKSELMYYADINRRMCRCGRMGYSVTDAT